MEWWTWWVKLSPSQWHYSWLWESEIAHKEEIIWEYIFWAGYFYFQSKYLTVTLTCTVRNNYETDFFSSFHITTCFINTQGYQFLSAQWIVILKIPIVNIHKRLAWCLKCHVTASQMFNLVCLLFLYLCYTMEKTTRRRI